ncbi:MAG: class I SAM-dependent methyltransferase [Solirubrobacteraceae bacterium]
MSAAASFSEALARVRGVEGWMTDAQARALWDAAEGLRPPGQIVEIGSFRGRSTIVLASARPDGVQMVAIDPHGGNDRGPQEYAPNAEVGDSDYSVFWENLHRTGVEDRVRHVREPSEAALGAVQGAIDLLYVDGAHRYVPARADIERYGERVPVGGAMLIHDSFNAIGVMLAQLRLLVFSRRWRYDGRRGSLAIYRREALGPVAALISTSRQLASVPWFVRNLLVKVAVVTKLTPLARLLGHTREHGPWPY